MKLAVLKWHSLIPLLAVLVLVVPALIGYGVVNSQSFQGTHDSDGDGLIEVEYIEQLNAIRYDLDGNGVPDGDSGSGVYASAFPGALCSSGCVGYELTRSLDFRDFKSYASAEVDSRWTSGDGWVPIGVLESPFNSTLDGNGNTLSNLYINRISVASGPEGVGYFGITGDDSEIRNVALIDVDVMGIKWVGGIAGVNHGTIRHSYSTGTVSGVSSCGGVAGTSQTGEVISSHSTSRISCSEHFAGGLVGFNYRSKISDSYATGEVNVDQRSKQVGGLVGHNSDSIITQSYATGQVSGHEEIGGLSGSNWKSSISDSYATGSVSGVSKIGGLVGINSNDGFVINSYATGTISGSTMVGGLIGENRAEATVEFSFATGPSTGSRAAGGLVGANTGQITYSYAAGDVSGNDEIGGLAGVNGEGAVVRSSYASGLVMGQQAIGGLIGSNSGEVVGAYAYGLVIGGVNVGGLIGVNESEYPVIATFSVGHVSGDHSVGGLIGLNSGRARVAYWDFETSETTSGTGAGPSAGIEGKTTADLQSPTGYTGIFLDWNIDLDNADRDFDLTTGREDYWDFGTSNQYPALKADFQGEGVSSWEEFGSQVRVRPTMVPSPTPTPTLEPTPTPTPTPTLKPTPTPTLKPMPTLTSTPTPMVAPSSTATALPTPWQTATHIAAPTDEPAETAIEISTPSGPTHQPDSGSGGACGLPKGDLPLGTATINLFLLAAPLGMLLAVKFRWRGTSGKNGSSDL